MGGGRKARAGVGARTGKNGKTAADVGAGRGQGSEAAGLGDGRGGGGRGSDRARGRGSGAADPPGRAPHATRRGPSDQGRAGDRGRPIGVARRPLIGGPGGELVWMGGGGGWLGRCPRSHRHPQRDLLVWYASRRTGFPGVSRWLQVAPIKQGFRKASATPSVQFHRQVRQIKGLSLHRRHPHSRRSPARPPPPPARPHPHRPHARATGGRWVARCGGTPGNPGPRGGVEGTTRGRVGRRATPPPPPRRLFPRRPSWPSSRWSPSPPPPDLWSLPSSFPGACCSAFSLPLCGPRFGGGARRSWGPPCTSPSAHP